MTDNALITVEQSDIEVVTVELVPTKTSDIKVGP